MNLSSRFRDTVDNRRCWLYRASDLCNSYRSGRPVDSIACVVVHVDIHR